MTRWHEHGHPAGTDPVSLATRNVSGARAPLKLEVLQGRLADGEYVEPHFEQLPVIQDIAYGRAGRLVKGAISKTQMQLARLRRVPIERFQGSYFHPPAKVLQVSVTNVCNARCSFCAYRLVADTERATGVMKMDVFKKTVDE